MGHLHSPSRALELTDPKEVMTMIEWGSPNWGGGVTYADNGSWITDPSEDTEPKQD